MSYQIDNKQPVLYRPGVSPAVPQYAGAQKLVVDNDAVISPANPLVQVESGPGGPQIQLTLPSLSSVEMGASLVIVRDTDGSTVLPLVTLPRITVVSATGDTIQGAFTSLSWFDRQPLVLLRGFDSWQVLSHRMSSTSGLGAKLLDAARAGSLESQYLSNTGTVFNETVAAAGTPQPIANLAYNRNGGAMAPSLGSFDVATGLFTVGPEGEGIWSVSFALTGTNTGAGPDWSVVPRVNGSSTTYGAFDATPQGEVSTIAARDLLFGFDPGDEFGLSVDAGTSGDTIEIQQVNTTIRCLF